jgi:hypothetical protein
MTLQHISFQQGSLGTRGLLLRAGDHVVDDEKFPELVELARERGFITGSEEKPKTETTLPLAELDEKGFATLAEVPEPPTVTEFLATLGEPEATEVKAKPTVRVPAKRGRPRKTPVTA